MWLSVLVLAVGSGAQAKNQTGNVTIAGQERNYTLFVPDSYSSERSVPLVVLLHGRFGTGTKMAALTDFNDLAEKHRFITLYPDGLNGEWNYVKDIPGYPMDAPDDTALLRALIRRVSDRYAIDASRIYVAGFSNGGFMAQRLACDAPEVFAAFASVAAAGFGGMDMVCPETGSARLLFIHGTFDTNIPWNGYSRQVGNQAVPILFSVSDTLGFWSFHNSCGSEISSRELSKSSKTAKTNVRIFTFTKCPEGAALGLYAIERGGHNWPGKPGRIPPEIAGTVSTEIDASEVIWNYFSRYRRGVP
jgi:polyhydroxybutyrate depolymerase